MSIQFYASSCKKVRFDKLLCSATEIMSHLSFLLPNGFGAQLVQNPSIQIQFD